MRKFVFDLYNDVIRTEARVTNHFGIELSADIYLPKSTGNQKLAGIVVGGPYGAVKEQASGKLR